ncbi:MAG TPA: hypothetical protein VMK12_11665 [Anaeromyxobacteraceae bacterium]|nr:hypothetical protein [Anaeromyxobacteraceae bacterium]
MTYIFIARVCTDLPVSTCCRVMKASTSGFYAWQANPVTGKDLADAALTNTNPGARGASRQMALRVQLHASGRGPGSIPDGAFGACRR